MTEGIMPPPWVRAMAGFAADDGSPRVYYLDLDPNDNGNHVIELALGDGGWSISDVTVLSGAAVTGGKSRLAGFLFDDGTVNGDSRVFFVDGAQHIWQLSGSNGKWDSLDVTNAILESGQTMAPPLPGSSLAGLAEKGALYWVYYIDASQQHVWQLTYNGDWTATDLTAAAAASGEYCAPAASQSFFAAFSCVPGDPQVCFADQYGNIWQIVSLGDGWVPINMTQLAGAPRAYVANQILGLSVSQASYRVYFEYPYDNAGRVGELAFTGNGWQWSDITGEAGAGAAFTGSTVSGFTVPGDDGSNDPRVYFVSPATATVTEHIWELAWLSAEERWGSTDISAAANIPSTLMAPVSLLGDNDDPRVYYVFPSWNGTNLVYYVNEAVWNGAQWVNNGTITAP